MISRRSRTTSAAAALATALALGVPAAAHAGSPGAADSGAATTPTASAIAATSVAVTLPTGDRVVVGTGAHQGLAVEQAPGGSEAFASFDVGGQRYVVPSEAAPYAGRQLDLSLFDVTKLAASASSPAAHIPVQLRFAAGVTPSAPAGVTLTSVSGQNATGYLTPDSGRAFAQALRESIKTDLAAGKRAGSGALFGGLTSMAALGATPPVRPDYPLHILQINSVDNTGAPSDVPVMLLDTDNIRAFAAQVFTVGGIARVAVPAGHYAAISLDFLFDSQAGVQRTDIVSQDGITVPATGTVPPALVDERTATSPISFTTAKPSSQIGGYVQVSRTDANGISGGLGLLGAGGQTYISPEAAPTDGTALNYAVNWVSQSPANTADPYRYNLMVTADHIAADQSYAPAQDSLAALHDSFDRDPAYGDSLAGFGSAAVTPTGWALEGMMLPGPSLTEYVTGGLKWFSEMSLPFLPNPSGMPGFGILDDDAQVFQPGQSTWRTWDRSPGIANLGNHPAAASNSFGCQACVGGGNLNVTLGMLGDSNQDTTGLDFSAAGTSQLYWNGRLISSDTNHFGYMLQNVPAGPGTVRTVFDYDRSATGISQGTKTHTDLTIPYSGKTDPSLTLPAGTPCYAALISSTPTAPCQILPGLTLNYQFNGLDDRNTSHSPIQNLVLRVGHLSYGEVGSRARIDSAHVAVSFDNGATWKDVATHGAFGTYVAHWSNPAAGGHVELKVTATDCLGGSITQTITDPYTVG